VNSLPGYTPILTPYLVGRPRTRYPPHIPQNPPLISGRILGDSRYGTTPDLTPCLRGGIQTPYLTRIQDPYFELIPPLISGRILVNSPLETTPDLTPILRGGIQDRYPPRIHRIPPLISGRILVDSRYGTPWIWTPILGVPVEPGILTPGPEPRIWGICSIWG